MCPESQALTAIPGVLHEKHWGTSDSILPPSKETTRGTFV